MNKEYLKNQKDQRKVLKKYRLSMRKMLIWSILCLLSLFIFPTGAFYTILKKFLSDYAAVSIAVWSQILCMGTAAIEFVINTVVSFRTQKKLNDLQDEEENIIDGILNENDELKKKLEILEKNSILEKENKEILIKAFTNKEKNFNLNMNEEESEKKYVK